MTTGIAMDTALQILELEREVRDLKRQLMAENEVGTSYWDENERAKRILEDVLAETGSLDYLAKKLVERFQDSQRARIELHKRLKRSQAGSE